MRGHERNRVSGRGPEQGWYEGERGSNGKGKTNWGGSWEARVEEFCGGFLESTHTHKGA